MEVIDRYLEYRKHKPDYKPWREKREDIEAKRLAYISKNNISQAARQEDIKRAKAVLDAIDVMDEYSQTRAEDMEVAVEGLATPASYGIMTISAVAGGLGWFLSKLANVKNKKISMISAGVCAFVACIAGYMKFAQWGASKEVEASKNGRFEAMMKDLSSAKYFAVLDDNQESKIDELAKNINITQKEANKLNNKERGFGFGFLAAYSDLIKGNNEEQIAKQKEFKNKIKEDKDKFDKVQLTQKQIDEAKRDQQLICNVVEKIDIASQDYAENSELVTGTLKAAALGSGGLIGLIANKILKNTKLTQYNRIVGSYVVGAMAALGLAAGAAQIQKQASRVARWKVKHDFMDNPEKLIYVDDEKVKNEDGSKFKSNEKKDSFFSMAKKIINDNKEYNKSIKSENLEKQKRIKAKEQITLSAQQEQRARQLQQNTFKMFNKLDEKSQSLSEHVEALGETVQTSAGLLVSLAGMSGISKMSKKMDAGATPASSMASVLGRMLIALIPTIFLNIYITKEQKNASRVANMLAIDEMSDYRNFADYTDAKTAEVKAK